MLPPSAAVSVVEIMRVDLALMRAHCAQSGVAGPPRSSLPYGIDLGPGCTPWSPGLMPALLMVSGFTTGRIHGIALSTLG